MTGYRCSLKCKYCMGKYLEGMYPVETPGELKALVRRAWKRGVRGILLSGGFTRDGVLPLRPFLPAVRELKKDYGLIVSVHPGLINEEDVKLLVEAGVDIVDFEVELDEEVIRDIKGLKKSPGDYARVLDVLAREGPPYLAPHVIIGVKWGRLGSEFEALDLISDYDPYLTVLLVFRPTPSTPMSAVNPPNIDDVVKVFKYARKVLRGEVSLGCMRPNKYKRSLDHALIERGLIDRLAVPIPETVRNHGLKVYGACCSVPVEHLHLFY